MGGTYCNHCGKEIQGPSGERCRWCGKAWGEPRQATADSPPLHPSSPPQPGNWWSRLSTGGKWVVAGGAAIAVLAVLSALGVGEEDETVGTSDAGQTVSDDRFGAASVCEDFVSRRLKAPGSAKFRDPLGDQISYVGDSPGPITVVASVDSENSFGASLRLPYSCTVSKTGEETWRLVSLEMDE